MNLKVSTLNSLVLEKKCCFMKLFEIRFDGLPGPDHFDQIKGFVIIRYVVPKV